MSTIRVSTASEAGSLHGGFGAPASLHGFDDDFGGDQAEDFEGGVRDGPALGGGALTPVHLDLTARGVDAMEAAIAALDMRTTQVVSVDMSGGKWERGMRACVVSTVCLGCV
jgi:hypothetical protein